MSGPLAGIRVLEAGVWIAAPAAGALLADWGADVIKIEGPTGDPIRGMAFLSAGVEESINPAFELGNRGKRAIVLDLEQERTREVLYRLLERTDVFLTNLRLKTLERLTLDYESISARFPRLIYCSVTGYGRQGPQRDSPAYDGAAFWARAGQMAAITPPGQAPLGPRAATGDQTTALSATAAISAALFARERSGAGQRVDCSLYRAGIYTMGWDYSLQLRAGRVAPVLPRDQPTNPLLNAYQAGDGRWFFLTNLQADRHWPAFCRAIGRPELLDDARFNDLRTRRRHSRELVRLLDEVFLTRSRAEWAAEFDVAGLIWAPVLEPAEVVDDEQAERAGAFTALPHGRGEPLPAVSGPVDFSATPWSVRLPAPEFGQHTEEILLELGYDWPAILELKDGGVIP